MCDLAFRDRPLGHALVLRPNGLDPLGLCPTLPPRPGSAGYQGLTLQLAFVALHALSIAIVDHHRRVEKVDRWRRTELLLYERPPLPIVEPVRIRARGP